jgi:methylated-DNA-[protein]-cysteine S-methyltransferase
MSGRERVRALLGHAAVASDQGVVQEIHLRAGARDDGTSPLAADLRRYFAGEPVDFGDFEVDLHARSEFERAVLAATRSIPFGQTRTYGQIARAIGEPDAARAVGQALARNPACIVIPCHRVVAANGALGGFTGGIRWKEALLRLEGSRF